jgi:uncharacterized protein (DUF1800 family)
MNKDGYIAATRFGMGMRPAEVSRIDTSPKDWLLAQIARPEARGSDFSGLASAQENARRLMEARQAGDKDLQKEVRRGFKDVFIEEMRAKMTHAIDTDTPFYERLVGFWSNHFAVSIKKGAVAGLAGAYEREAIRPNVTGRFADMLLAVVHHPAMLIYLDNAQSIGRDSMAGERTGKGLNENLAREIMELHTLGVGSGYTQQDVTTFAKILTGWSIGGVKSDNAGGFEFARRRHEPGEETILGKTYADNEEEQGIAVLSDLAAHPATAHHIAFKLARHFIADDPPDNVVASLAATFTQTGGDLKAMYRALLDQPSAWVVSPPKIKSSYDLIVSAARLCGDKNTAIDWCLQSLKFLGDVPLTANSPAGFPDVAKDIAGPEAVLRRIEWAQGAAGKLSPDKDYKTLAEIAIGPIMEVHTREVLSSAHNEREGLALLFGSPEFQRR